MIIAKKTMPNTNNQQGIVLQAANTQKAVLINPSQIQVFCIEWNLYHDKFIIFSFSFLLSPQNMQRNVNIINPQQISTITNSGIKIQKTPTQTNQIIGSNIKLVKVSSDNRILNTEIDL